MKTSTPKAIAPTVAAGPHLSAAALVKEPPSTAKTAVAQKQPAVAPTPEVPPSRPMKSGLNIAEVQLNRGSVAAPPSRSPKVSAPVQKQVRRHGAWINVALVVLVAGLAVLIAKAASNSWHLRPAAEFDQANTAPSITREADTRPKTAGTETAPVATLYFAEDSASLDPDSRSSLREVAGMLAAKPDRSLTIEGHTDNSGPEAYNLDLSNRRAQTVRDALVNELNISAERLRADGLGSAQPVQSNSSSKGRAFNRRVEIRVAD